MKKPPFDTYRLARFFGAELPEKEHQEVLDWLASLAEQEQADFMDAQLDVLTATPAHAPAQSGFEQLSAAIRNKQRLATMNWLFRAAAVILPLLVLFFYTKQPDIQPAMHVARQQGKKATTAIIQLSNTLNQNHTVQLPDSSFVELYPGASINYLAVFNPKKREIQLTGKAFFKVKHDQLRPFTVQTGAITTVVLGTSFWVDATAKTGIISVKVKTGKVGVVHASQKTVFLLPAEKAVFNAASGLVLRVQHLPAVSLDPAVPTVPATAIAFNETPLKQVLKVLAENFNTKITPADSVNVDAPVSLNTKGKSISTILEEIKSQIPITYEIKGKYIRIRKKE